MTCIHGFGSSVVYYIIYDIPIYNEIVNFDMLDDHEPISHHRPFNLAQKFVMQKSPIEENYNNQNYSIFNKNKDNAFLGDLNNELNILLNKDNIEDLYHNFTTTVSTSTNKLSIEVLCKKENIMVNPWYDKECNIDIKTIRDASNESLKFDKINRDNDLIKRKKGTI
jgi:hypothetical protein